MGFVINEGAIQDKVKAFGMTSAGKTLIENVVRTRITTGRSICKIEGFVLDEGAMYSAAGIMKDLIMSSASGLPASVQNAVASLSIGNVEDQGGGFYSIDLSFEGDLARPSLQPSRYGGVDNIIALFNNGYSARKQVWGEWPGHGKVGSKVSRSGLHFVNNAVATFNSKYGQEYNVMAIPDGQYR